LKSISVLSREYEISRPAVLAVLDEHDVPVEAIGPAKCARDEDLERVRPVLDKLRSKARARRGEAMAV
jgi:hypothetical protein